MSRYDTFRSACVAWAEKEHERTGVIQSEDQEAAVEAGLEAVVQQFNAQRGEVVCLKPRSLEVLKFVAERVSEGLDRPDREQWSLDAALQLAAVLIYRVYRDIDAGDTFLISKNGAQMLALHGGILSHADAEKEHAALERFVRQMLRHDPNDDKPLPEYIVTRVIHNLKKGT
jgi:hypothetical protein